MTTLLAVSSSSEDFWIIIALISFGSVWAHSTARRRDIRNIERKLDALIAHLGVSPGSGLSPEVEALARDPQQKIAALKRHREQTGLGLAEAKADIEDFIKTVR